MKIPDKYRNVTEFSIVVEIIIDEIAIETELPIEMILSLLSDYYDMSIDEIETCLSKIDSKYIEYNRVVGYIDGKPMKRTSESMAVTKIIQTIGRKVNSVIEIETNDEISAVVGAIHEKYKQRSKYNK